LHSEKRERGYVRAEERKMLIRLTNERGEKVLGNEGIYET